MDTSPRIFVVALHGRKYSGKSTLSRAIVDHLDTRLKNALIVTQPPASFADPLKAGVRAMFGITVEPVNKEHFYPEYGLTYRQMLQIVGMAMRNIEWPEGPMKDRFGREVTLWVKRMDERITQELVPFDWSSEHAHKAFLWVIDDLRLPDEAEWVKRMGGIMVKIDRPSLPPNTDSHVSEVPLPDHLFNVMITNDDTDPEQLVRPIMGSLLTKACIAQLPLGKDSRDEDG